jgi:2-polyprenyl-6-methoxyphenol hydroxylase-like FAD-dependent oxidoreductase
MGKSVLIELDVYLIFFLAADTSPTETGKWQLILTQWGSTEQPEENEERMKRMKKVGSEFCEPFKSAFSWVKDDTYIFPDRFASWNSPALWDNHSGHITLAGDAAHPMTPFRGQGLNNALQDSAAFCDALKTVISGEKSLKEAINVYDKEVYERGVREIQISLKVGYATHHLDVFVKSQLASSGMKRIPTEGAKD